MKRYLRQRRLSENLVHKNIRANRRYRRRDDKWSGFAPNSKFTQYNFHYTCNLVLRSALWVARSAFFFFSVVGKGLCITTGTMNETWFFSKNKRKRRHETQEVVEKRDREKKGRKRKKGKMMKRQKESEERNMWAKKVRKEKIFKKRSHMKKETLKRWIKLKEMLEQMKAEGDDERKRATEKHTYMFFENWTRRWSKWKIPKRRDEKSRMKKKRKKMEKQKKRKTLGKTSIMIHFSRITWCQKRVSVAILAQAVAMLVKHLLYPIRFQLYLLHGNGLGSRSDPWTSWAIVASLGSSTANAFRRSRCGCTTIA